MISSKSFLLTDKENFGYRDWLKIEINRIKGFNRNVISTLFFGHNDISDRKSENWKRL